jgi:hypothetical protein
VTDSRQDRPAAGGWVDRFTNYPYTFLFASIVALFILLPLVENRAGVLVPLLFLLVVLSVLRTLGLHRGFLRFCLTIGLLGFALQAAVRLAGLSATVSHWFQVVAAGLYVLFLSIVIVVFVQKIFTEENVKLDTIKGGISVYFLMGCLWAFLYQLLLLVTPEAISIAHYTGRWSDYLYFSFTTLTTLGYGDIVPVSGMARNLTILESSLGQIYMTVLIARLVGLHMSTAERA